MNWRYYNHALLPTTPPHENAHVKDLESEEIWKDQGFGTPIFARWTEEFDCGRETQWWYCIKKAPYVFDDLSRKSRKHIRQSLKKCKVEKVEPHDYTDEIWRVYLAASEKYSAFQLNVSEQDFKREVLTSKDDWWLAWNSEGQLIGWINCSVYDDWVNTISAKFDPHYLNDGPSAAIYHFLLDEYLNVQNKNYVSGGERSIVHHTNTQDYKIQKFNYTKAYCLLKVKYNPRYVFIVKSLYPFRKLLNKFSNNASVNKIVGLLRIEEIVRGQDE